MQPVANIGGGGAQDADVQFVINGPDLRKLEAISQAAASRACRSLPGVVDVDTSLNVGKPELSVQVDRPKAADLGVQISDAAEALRLLVGGDQVTTYNEGGEQYEVHLRARTENRSTEAGDRGPERPVVAARQRHARQRRRLLAGHGALRHQPPGAAAAGDGVLQPAAERVAGGSAERHPGRIRPD